MKKNPVRSHCWRSLDKRSHRQQNRLESFAPRLPWGKGENILLRHYLASLQREKYCAIQLSINTEVFYLIATLLFKLLGNACINLNYPAFMQCLERLQVLLSCFLSLNQPR